MVVNDGVPRLLRVYSSVIAVLSCDTGVVTIILPALYAVNA